MKLVIVESPAKAKTIKRCLGQGYDVMASYGHVRDLPNQDDSVLPDRDFEMVWRIDPDSKKRVNELIAAARRADSVLLASDPDREGEAISWHLSEIFKESRRRGDPEANVDRISFNAVTPEAVRAAVAAPRGLDRELVDAYLARRALDYLYGFTLSPLLWRKLPGARSAGRVQSTALRLVCDRELERDLFESREYWSIDVDLLTPEKKPFSATLIAVDGEKLDKFALENEKQTLAVAARLEKAEYRTASVERKKALRHPPPPFVTSTLQQEAARHFRFAAAHTMRVAQTLYEGLEIRGEPRGLITYMRTDGVQIAETALEPLRREIGARFGAAYLPPAPRRYKSKARNAQEAHEAIRPTDPGLHPDEAKPFLTPDQAKLYALIWKRAVACQMKDAIFQRTTVDIEAREDDRNYGLRANGSVCEFDGFLALYRERSDDSDDDADAAETGKAAAAGARKKSAGKERKSDAEDDDRQRLLPPIAVDSQLTCDGVRPDRHATEPPPRFTEASLVKEMERLGVGRPSTYAPTLSVLQERGYVRKEGSRLTPEDKGRIVSAFLTAFFGGYVNHEFTAHMEVGLDDVSVGKVSWKTLLRRFWEAFKADVDGVGGRRTGEILETLNDRLAAFLFPRAEGEDEPRRCPQCGGGRLSLKNSRHGPFIGCEKYPECRYTRSLSQTDGKAEAVVVADRELGFDHDGKTPIYLKDGRYGPYVQRGDGGGEEKPKRASIPKGMIDDLTLETALKLLALPRVVGDHPEGGGEIVAGIGPYGPYLRHEKRYANLASNEEVFEIGLNRAVTLIAEKAARGGRGQGTTTLKELGEHPEDGRPVRILDGRYGPYVNHGKINATLPPQMQPDAVSLEEGLALLAAKIAAGSKKKRRPPGGGAKRGGAA